MTAAPAVLELEDELLEQRRSSELSGVGPWRPPGAVRAPRQCVRCHGGLQPSDADGGPCSTCRYYLSAIEPRRPR
jgi:hypothetical protein